ncbi:hypothetical protein H2200_013636 [Cladophialophora chaetospira]|uniref:Glycosyl transferase family 25 domain-containing protein n=1 Tax=Cladophialophora chaetospira TaxID=386627 RepID=A0AA38TX39_9EURO|nr:hypothetical protein H2200_013636 [Cladophialophora chaetospira]
MLARLGGRYKVVVLVASITLFFLFPPFRILFLETHRFLRHTNAFPSHIDYLRAKLTFTKTPLSDSIYQVQNETLGFEEIYLISLPERTDKQDAFAIQAAFSNISYTLVDGVHGDEVSTKALPHTMSQKATIIGCWRAHLNIYQKMVHENVSTALIFEDDADWDVALKHQLVQFARASRFIGGIEDDHVASSPYGDDWDVLWLGHCGTWVLPDDEHRFFVIPHDPTVQPPRLREENVAEPNMSHWRTGHDNGDQTRVVFRSEGAVCTAAYAISQKGARKALYSLSMIPYNAPVDWGIANLCKSKQYDFTCISSWPQLIGVSRPTSHIAKWSDVERGTDFEDEIREGGSHHLMYSVRQNIPEWLNGKTIFRSSHSDVGPPLPIDDIGKATGYAETLTSEQMGSYM